MGLYIVTTRNENLAAGTAETLLVVAAPSTSRIRVVAWGVSLAGITSSEVPGDVELLRITSDPTGSAFTPVQIDPADPAASATAKNIITVEPSYGDLLHPIQLTPNGGLYETEYAPDRRPIIAASARVGIRANFAAAQTSGGGASAWLLFEE